MFSNSSLYAKPMVATFGPSVIKPVEGAPARHQVDIPAGTVPDWKCPIEGHHEAGCSLFGWHQVG